MRDVSFNAERGSILGFLGPNGAGKTTTMRIITGFMPASSGTVVIDDLDIFENSLEARRESAICQKPRRSIPICASMRICVSSRGCAEWGARRSKTRSTTRCRCADWKT